MLAEEEVDAVEEVRAEHRDLVDDDGPELPDQGRVARLAAARAHLLRGRVDPEPEEPVHGLAAHVEGGDPGRGEDDRLPPRDLAEAPEQGRLPRPRLAGDEEVPFARFHQREGAGELRVDLDAGLRHGRRSTPRRRGNRTARPLPGRGSRGRDHEAATIPAVGAHAGAGVELAQGAGRDGWVGPPLERRRRSAGVPRPGPAHRPVSPDGRGTPRPPVPGSRWRGGWSRSRDP